MTMEWTVREIMRDHDDTKNRTVSREEYEQWARGFIFEGLRNQRYGQSFCNRFDITDNILFYAGTVAEADRYIRKVYVR